MHAKPFLITEGSSKSVSFDRVQHALCDGLKHLMTFNNAQSLSKLGKTFVYTVRYLLR